MHGALLINKHPGISSFGVIEALRKDFMKREAVRRRELPKMGHGGTLDPFATGLLVVCVGRGVKVARYFLGSDKAYEGVMRFGETTAPGDPTEPVTERSERVPEAADEIREVARRLTLQPYLQTPPMYSAKKKDGKPLYELARQGVEIDREPKLCRLRSFEILGYERPRATFRLRCSSGTYVRALAQDLGKLMGSVAMLDSLHRGASGIFDDRNAWSVDQVIQAAASGQSWDELPCWIPFHRLLDGFDRAQATSEEARALLQGRQNVLFNILKKVEPSADGARPLDSELGSYVAIYYAESLIAVASRHEDVWGLERVFAD